MGLIALWCAAGPTITRAQTDFDVVSVKINRSDEDSGIFPRPGRFVAVNTPLSEIVLRAFDFPRYRTAGIEKLGRDRYDITATFTGTITGPELRSMVRRLLSSRFGLRTHTELKRTRVYLLERANKNGALGPQIKPTKSDCAPTDRGGLTCWVTPRNGSYVAKGVDWSEASLRVFLAALLESPIIDKTGLSGQFDIELTWQAPGAAVSSDNDLGKPTLFAALVDQLGLRLVPGNEPVEFLVIDQVHPPTEN
jgi:uncharacterized protein (TIGR03435 family)